MVSSKDVAKYAGVSQTTVSRVLNSPDLVQKKTLDKVQNAINELNYRPNSVARSLVNNKTKSIALLSGPLHNPFFAESTTSIVNYAKEKGFNVNVHFENFGSNMEVYQDMVENTVDGIILSSILYEDSIFERLNRLDIPFVMFNRKHKELGHFVEMDNVQAGRLATAHLISLKHQHIAWVGGPLNMSTFWGRFEGYKQVLTEEKIPLEQHNIIITDTSRESIFKETASIMSRKNRPTAIYAATDSIAIFIMDYLLQKGYEIPRDISIIGTDNVNLSAHASFQLSTVTITTEQNLGRIAVETLFNLIEGQPFSPSFIQKTIETSLLARKTTLKL
ncbi:MAG TPA: LacI family transcriptional regulator [Sporosarcina psychrophila]|uniref:LacI family transcriptional regulator n=1 Tax=Sporosarcina psychrophila TaxID=1476 RepID=A0A921KEF5_SPOPS|nr:LacI family transcriptional regulator [Sporosarcina psychrophila]